MQAPSQLKEGKTGLIKRYLKVSAATLKDEVCVGFKGISIHMGASERERKIAEGQTETEVDTN